jgi:hypothetical protein
MDDFESTLIRETDTHDDFFGSSPTPLFQEQIVPQWGADHPSARSVIFGSISTPSPHGSPPRASSPYLPSHVSSPNLSQSSPPASTISPLAPSSLHHSQSITQQNERASINFGHTLGPNLSVNPSSPIHFRSPSVSRRLESQGSESPLRTEGLIKNSETQAELRRAESQFRLESPVTARTTSPTKGPELRHEGSKSDISLERKAPDTIAHLHEKMAATLAKVEKTEKPIGEKSERLLHYSDIPALRNAELQFKHPDDKGTEESGSPWDDSFNSSIRTSQKTPRRETELGKGR